MFEVAGHKEQMRMIKRAFVSQRFAHAYIVYGPDGVGKSVFALYMASLVLCKADGGDPMHKPCGKCEACHKIINNIHPDVMVSEPVKKGIIVDEIRELIDEIHLKPYEGDYKVIIIKDTQNMTPQAQNAFLKTLEEPDEGSFIIMLTSSLETILETIQSRCQIIRLGRIPEDEVRKYLMDNGIEPERAELAAALSDGIIGNALRMIDEGYMQLRRETVETACSIIKGNALDAFTIYEWFSKNKSSIDDILDNMISWYRDLIMLKSTSDKSHIVSRDYYELLVEESQILSYNRLNVIIKVIMDTKEKLRQNVNFQLAIEVMLLNIQEV
jgi:DNA polymerase-3 subunit delta'